MTFQRLIITACMCCVLGITGCASWDAAYGNAYGNVAYNKGDYHRAAAHYNLAATQGDSHSQYMLGMMYFLGEGVAQDYQEAAKWYRLAAAQGHAEAQNNLGWIYRNVQGVTQDSQEAPKQPDMVPAAQILATMQAQPQRPQYSASKNTQTFADSKVAYDKGDYAQAIKLVRPLAAQGNAIAQTSLGVLYEYGKGVTQDYQEALKWYRLAAAQGEADAQNHLGSMYRRGLGVTQEYQEAMKWHHLAAVQGNAGAQANLGALYFFGEGVPEDYQEALKWFRLAAAQGSEYAKDALKHPAMLAAAAQNNIVQAQPQRSASNITKTINDGEAAYYKGDYAQAIKIFSPLAAQGNVAAQYALGVMYGNGQGVTQDYQEALKWYRLAAAQGYAAAQNNLGWMYQHGNGVTQDYQETLKWYRLAEAQGFAAAQYNLGVMYSNGEGVTQNYQEALKWFRLAAAQGDAAAQNNIDALQHSSSEAGHDADMNNLEIRRTRAMEEQARQARIQSQMMMYNAFQRGMNSSRPVTCLGSPMGSTGVNLLCN